MSDRDSAGWIDAEAAGCRLLLRVGGGDDAAGFVPPPGLVGLVMAPSSGAATWQAAARRLGVASLAEEAMQDGSDGVLLADPAQVAPTRRRRGEAAIIGCRVGPRRDAAMAAGENGADFIQLGATDQPLDDASLEFVQWWNEVTVLPVAVALEFDDKRVAAAVAAGAGFVLLDRAPLDAAALDLLARRLG